MAVAARWQAVTNALCPANGVTERAEALGAKMTERGQYRFVAKESARGHFWVAAEPARDTIKSLDDCVLGFDLEPGVSHSRAVAVADFLNRNIVAITLS